MTKLHRCHASESWHDTVFFTFSKVTSFQKLFSSVLLLLSLAFSSILYAQEPLNLDIAKQTLIHYHDSGEYEKDLGRVIDEAMLYLMKRTSNSYQGKKPAIILDIDETALSNYVSLANVNFDGSIQAIRRNIDKGTDPALSSTLKLYRFAKSHHLAVFFLTGRQEEERNKTASNLKNVGFDHWDGLILRSERYKKAPATLYKTAMRKQLTEQGYDIVLNIGDQLSDLRGGYADKAFKLPNPFYLIP